jgi:hypothetical protein
MTTKRKEIKNKLKKERLTGKKESEKRRELDFT